MLRKHKAEHLSYVNDSARIAGLILHERSERDGPGVHRHRSSETCYTLLRPGNAVILSVHFRMAFLTWAEAHAS